MSCADILCGLEKVIVTSADPLVVVNALVSVVVDLIGCMS
jgi:vesicle coat complex subunit